MSAEDQYDSSVAIAYPYVFPQDTDLPIDYSINGHCTLLYLGNVQDLKPSDRFVIEAVLDILKIGDQGIVDVSGLEMFGPENEVLVMTLNSSELIANHEKVVTLLSIFGIKGASKYEYRPHITLNQNYSGSTDGFALPTTVGLGAPTLWWGDERG